MILMITANQAFARFEAYIGGTIGNTEPRKTIVVVPRGYNIQRPNERIYTPDRYHCYMRKTLKYCATRRDRPLNGIIVNSGYDGAISYETYQNGYQNGETLLYTQDGNLISRSNYRNGIKHGEEIIYFFNSRAEFVLHYKDGALDGRVEQYDVNGALVGKMNYKKGWFKDGYCKNEAKNSSMHDRIKNKKYNEVIACGSAYEE
jgi:antitoxin component YwqK of YwqJK toxin-antitoxin module